jgi:hypothetical protein
MKNISALSRLSVTRTGRNTYRSFTRTSDSIAFGVISRASQPDGMVPVSLRDISATDAKRFMARWSGDKYVNESAKLSAIPLSAMKMNTRRQLTPKEKH